ncbi:MAG: alpha/beta fold hydrolase [Candidatus Rokubacteria bacterium]|nr:alpha/beta fold hydrolase [Candidatus Rokubacteria bacterium]
MSTLDVAPGESLYYEYDAPGAAGATFVFVNALTGHTATWQHADIGPRLHQAGYGTLTWNFRGQAQTQFAPGTTLSPHLVVEDLRRVVAHVAPPRPILVGLSIGGLFAARGYLTGVPATALVLVNTLRKSGPRLEWINQAMVAMARTGGTQLVMEANLPMLVNPEQLQAMRSTAFSGKPYQPMDPADGLFRLMAGSLATDWDVPYERLALPVLVMTGLHDRVFYMAADVEELTARIPGVRVVTFPDAGHLIPVERPRAFADALLAFARSL